jgi:hypothetical protein
MTDSKQKCKCPSDEIELTIAYLVWRTGRTEQEIRAIYNNLKK